MPQIVSVARDRNGATAISYTTWGLFAESHLSTVAYAILTLDDWRMAAVFVANAACCTVIVGLTALKRAGLKLTADPPMGTIANSAAPRPAPQRDGAFKRAALTVALSPAGGRVTQMPSPAPSSLCGSTGPAPDAARCGLQIDRDYAMVAASFGTHPARTLP